MADQEQQQLDLVVELIDNATPQLARLRSELRQIGQFGSGEQITKITRQMEQLNQQVRPLAEEAAKANSAMTLLGRGVRTAVLGAAGAAYAFYDIGQKLREFSQRLIDLNNASRATGFSAAQIKGVVDQMAQFGISGAAAVSNIQSFATSLADLGRQGSELRQKLMQMSQSDPQAMQQFIYRLLGARDRNDLVSAMQEIVTAADNTFNNAIRRGLSPVEAADIRKRFLAEFHLTPEMLNIIERLQGITKEQEASLRRQIELSQQFTKEWEKAKTAVDNIWMGLQSELTPAMTEVTKLINEQGEAWGKGLGQQIIATVRDVKQLIGDLRDIWQFLQARPEDVERRINENQQKPSGWDWLRQRFGGAGGAGGGTEPQRFMGGGVPSGGAGRFIPDPNFLADSPMSTNIEDRRGELIETETDEMRTLVGELKRLNDFLWGTTAGVGGAGVGAGGGIGGGTVGFLSGGAGGGGGGGLGRLSTQLGGLGAGLGGGTGMAGGGGAPMGGLPGMSSGGRVGPGSSSGGGGAGTGSPHGSSVAPGRSSGGGRGGAGGMTPAAGGGAFPPSPFTARGGTGRGAGADIYQKMLTEFRNSDFIGKVPPDGAQFGITTGSAEEWARFGTAVAEAESSFNPATKNLSDPGGSFGVLQYAHEQVPGGNAYDVDASVKAFVRDAGQAMSSGGIRSRDSLLRRRFSTIGSHPGRTIRNLKDYETGPPQLTGRQFLPGPIGSTMPTEGGGDLESLGIVDSTGRSTRGYRGPLENPQAIVTHHTAGGTMESAVSALNSRGLAYNYIVDRDGTIHHFAAGRGAHMLPGSGRLGAGLSNANTIGISAVGTNEANLTPVQVERMRALAGALGKKYGIPPSAVFGHGQVNPGHREISEGAAVYDWARGLGGQWPGGKGTVSRPGAVPFLTGAEETSVSGGGWRESIDRTELDKATAEAFNVKGTGKVDVEVKQAKGATESTDDTDKLFKKEKIERQTQMEPAKEGPATSSSKEAENTEE